MYRLGFSRRIKPNDDLKDTPNTSVELVVIDDDDNDEVFTVKSDSSIQCQNLEDSQNDSVNQESNKLKKVLQSDIPDEEKESFLKQHGIRINRAKDSNKEKKTDDELWLVDKVAETDKALNYEKEKPPECDIILID